MTYQEVYDKFMIEYDKATVTASYPSFTQYEICTFLDKAYLALIAQKLTGNNPRGIGFEGDVKAIHDLQGLLINLSINVQTDDADSRYADNVFYVGNYQDSQILYIISAQCNCSTLSSNKNCKFVSLEIARKSFVTDSNYPTVKNPLLFFGSNTDSTSPFIYIVLDPDYVKSVDRDGISLYINAISKPVSFIDKIQDLQSTNFKLNDEMAGELVNLAVTIALENIQSPRLQTKAQLNQLES